MIKSLAVVLLGCASTASLATAAHAQDAGAATPSADPAVDEGTGAEARGIDEIIVTAQRRSQNIQDVPVAITAFDSAALERQGISNVSDVQFHAPNIAIREEASISGLSVGIRGINVSVDNFAYDSAVGVYENGVFIARGSSFGSLFYDMDSVQILRGPQGTLFGRATPVGAVLIDTAKVTSDTEGYLQVGIGGGGKGIGDGADRSFYRIEGAVNLPITESFGVRLAGYGVSDDGWGRSRVTGYKFAARDDFGFRGSLRFNPDDRLDVNLVMSYNKSKRGMPLFVPLEVGPGANTSNYDGLVGGTAANDAVIRLAAERNAYENESIFRDQRARSRQFASSLNIDYKFSDSVSLKSITGFRAIRTFQVNDLQGIPFPESETTDTMHQDQFTQELLLNIDVTDRLNLVTGVYYFQETGFEENILLRNTVNKFTPLARNNRIRLRGEDIKNVAKSVFANLSFKVTDGLTLSGGARYTDESKRMSLDNATLDPFVQTAAGTYRFKDKVTVYDVRADWQATSDLLLYAKFGTGYRPGGVAFRSENATFGAEHSETFEIGEKLDFDIGSVPVRLNSAVFHTKYKGFQVGVTVPDPTRTIIVNTGSATVKGAEFELSLRPVENLNLSASLGLIDAKLNDFIINDISLGGRVDFSNNELRYAPSTTFSMSASYRIETGAGDIVPSIDYSHQSTYLVDTQRQPKAPPVARTSAFVQKPTDIVNVRLAFEDAFNSNVDIALWVKNLTDEKRLSYGLNVGRLRYGVYGEPLSFGLDVKMRF